MRKWRISTITLFCYNILLLLLLLLFCLVQFTLYISYLMAATLVFDPTGSRVANPLVKFFSCVHVRPSLFTGSVSRILSEESIIKRRSTLLSQPTAKNKTLAIRVVIYYANYTVSSDIAIFLSIEYYLTKNYIPGKVNALCTMI